MSREVHASLIVVAILLMAADEPRGEGPAPGTAEPATAEELRREVEKWRAMVMRRPDELRAGQQLGLKYQVEDLRKHNEQLRTRIEELEKELSAAATARADRGPRDAQAMVFKLRSENAFLQRRVDALVTQEREAVRLLEQLQRDHVGRRDAEQGQQKEMVKQLIADRDKVVADMQRLREDFVAQQAVLRERQDALAKSYTELKKKMATLEDQKAAAYRFASCSYQFVKGALASPDPAMRRWAAEKLYGLGSDMKPAGGLLVEALKDQDPQVQQAARAALKEIDPELAIKQGVE